MTPEEATERMYALIYDAFQGYRPDPISREEHRQRVDECATAPVLEVFGSIGPDLERSVARLGQYLKDHYRGDPKTGEMTQLRYLIMGQGKEKDAVGFRFQQPGFQWDDEKETIWKQ